MNGALRWSFYPANQDGYLHVNSDAHVSSRVLDGGIAKVHFYLRLHKFCVVLPYRLNPDRLIVCDFVHDSSFSRMDGDDYIPAVGRNTQYFTARAVADPSR